MKKIFFISISIYLLSSISYAQGPHWIIFNTSNSGIPTNSIFSIEIDSNNVKWLTCTSGLIKFDSNSWLLYNNSNSPINNRTLHIIKDKYNGIWFSVVTQGLMYLKNGVFTVYNSSNSGLPYNNILGLAIESDTIKWMSSGNSKLVRYDGVSWNSYDSTNSGFKNDACNDIAVIDSIKWLSTLFNGLVKYDNHTWTYYTPQNSGIQDYWITSVSIESSEIIWMGTRNAGAHRYNLSLNQWTYYNINNSPLSENFITSIFKNKYDGNLYISPAYYGIANLQNGNWTIFGSPLVNGTGVERYKRDKYNNLWMATNNGLIVYNPNGVVKIQNTNNVINNFQLFQNYPNPFNPSTIINYQLTINSFVTLNIYDINGRLVKELVNKKQSAGNYSIDFDGSGLPSGTYVYRLQAGDFSETKKMVLLK